MGKKTLQNILLLNLLIFCLLLSECEASPFGNDSEKETPEKRDTVMVLMTSSNNLQFRKENNFDGIGLTYDCSLGLRDEGVIDWMDSIHPTTMSSLIIQNCHNITFKTGNTNNFRRFRKLIIQNVTYVSLLPYSNYRHGYYDNEYYIANFDKIQDTTVSMDTTVSIRNCDVLKFLSDGYADRGMFNVNRNISLTLENVFIDTLQSNTFTKKMSLHMKNVRIENIMKNAISFTKDSTSVLVVENSQFEYVHSNAFSLNGSTVKIFNNTFKTLGEKAFSIQEANREFIFAHNFVRTMENPFYVYSPRVEIVHNTFESSNASWLSEIVTHGFKDEGILNVSENIIKNLPLFGKLKTIPDFFHIKNNYFHCTCRYFILLSDESQNLIKSFLLNKNNKNVCANFGNCTLQTALQNIDGICMNNFQCTEHQSNENVNVQNIKITKNVTQEYLKSILSVLENIYNKLDFLTTQNSFSLNNRTELITAESETSELPP